MSTLYQSTSRSRKIVVGFLLLTLVLVLWNAITSFFKSINVVVDPEANRYYFKMDPKLGAIPKAEIDGIEYNEDARFEQLSEHFQWFPDVSYVYAIEQPRQKLLAVERAEETIIELGFDIDNRVEGEDPDELVWTKDNDSKTVTYNKVSQVWKMRTVYRENPDAIRRKTLSTLESYITQARSAINRLDFDTFGFESPTIEAIYTSLGVDGVFRETQNASDANYVFIEVSRQIPLALLKTEGERPLVPEGLENIIVDITGKVYSDDPRFGQIHFIASDTFTNYATELFEMDFINYEYNSNNTGIYPITTPDEAWVNIQRGLGTLVMIQPQGENYYSNFDSIEVRAFTADFRDTKLGFWEPKIWNGFVVPIYIFEGTAQLADGRLADFIFYVDAIKRSN